MIATPKIEHIYFTDHLIGGSRGALLGFFGGMIYSAVALDKDAEMAGFAGLAIVGVSTAAGLLSGAIIGTKMVYGIEADSTQGTQIGE